MPVCRTLDFLCLGLMGLAAFLTRFALFLRVASRFLALAMAVPSEHAVGKRKHASPANTIFQQFVTPHLEKSAPEQYAAVAMAICTVSDQEDLC